MIKKRILGSFVSVDVTRRTRKSKFLHPIDTLIDWSVFEKELHKVCKRSIQDAAGRPAYSPLVLFKMLLLQTWYNLSDMGVEDVVNDTLSANAFRGLRVEGTVPDHSTLSRFRSELSEKRAMNRPLKATQCPTRASWSEHTTKTRRNHRCLHHPYPSPTPWQNCLSTAR